ncbi:hypothetical protein DL767_004640 [Monosporascus sp. MG133]|nr:hypothetical protein DL767_004640 [Monosporascus sp. MG133]
MEDRPVHIPMTLDQPLSVDFIENRLPRIHEAFENLPTRYDSKLKRFVPILNQASPMPPEHRLLGAAHDSLKHDGSQHDAVTQQSNLLSLQARKLPPEVGLMAFWDSILGKAQEKFKSANPTEPKKLQEKPQYRIRSMKNWNAIYARLQTARETFDSTKSGFWGRFKKGYRNLADKSGIAQQTLKLVPDLAIVSPVKAALEVILDAAETASDAREKITGAFNPEDLEKTFAQVELFLAIFPGDENITKACIRLVADILNAVEGTIVYFLSHTGKRFFGSLQGKGDFQKELLDSIAKIQAGTCDLIVEAQMSHMAGTRAAMLKVMEQAARAKRELHGGIKVVGTKVDDLANYLQVMFDDGVKNREILCQIVARQQNGLYSLVRDLEAARSRSPSPQPPQQLARHPPQHLLPSSQQQQPPWNVSQQMVWPSQYLQIPFQLYHQQQGTGAHHFHGPSAAPSVAYSLFPVPVAPLQEPTLHVSELLAALNISDLDKMDIEAIIELGDAIPLRYRSSANRIVKSDAFHAWATSARSCELLIQGHVVADTVQARAAMSLVSASIMQGLRGRARFVPLVFFCGRHVEYDDEFAGGSAMIRSLTAQLLQQYFANATFRKQDVHLEALEDVDIDIVCGLFGWLVRHLPQNMTVICVLDDASCYENRRYEADMRRVMEFLLGLARDESMPPAVKVLATCPAGTVDLHKLFKRDDSAILSMEGLPSMGEELGMLKVEDEL